MSNTNQSLNAVEKAMFIAAIGLPLSFLLIAAWPLIVAAFPYVGATGLFAIMKAWPGAKIRYQWAFGRVSRQERFTLS